MKLSAAVLSLFAFLLAAPTRSALASCAADPGLRQHLGDARTAFVGQVIETSNARRNASVRVEKIWLGPALPARVEVQGGAQGEGVVSSVDRTYRTGETYLFVLRDAREPFSDDSCSGTTVYTERVAELEPEGAIGPEGAGTTGGAALGPWVLVGVALLAVGALQVRRATRRTRSLEID